MASQSHVPATTIQRLPVYLRCLLRAQQQRVSVINSVGIAEMAGTNAAQVRKDLSYLGEYGTRGIGYDVDELATHLMRWLGLSEERRAAIVGFGRLGSALTGYEGFSEKGVRIVAVLDADPAKLGIDVDGMEVEPFERLGEVFAREGVEIAIITVPSRVAQDVADAAVEAGTRAILNFAPVRLEVPDGVEVRQADVAAELQILSFHLNAQRAGEADGEEEHD
jgi:redox-sensing transcriptional repressor